MALTDSGAILLAQMLRGASVTPCNAAYAHLGFGSGGATAFDKAQTDLQGASKTRVAMDSGYPSGASNVLLYQATASTSVANHDWSEVGLFNASSGGTMVGRRVESPTLGTKTSAQAWTYQLSATVSA